MRGKKSYNIQNVEAHLDVNISKLDQQTNFPNQNNMPVSVYLLHLFTFQTPFLSK
jgi:hypothetical protein